MHQSFVYFFEVSWRISYESLRPCLFERATMVAPTSWRGTIIGTNGLSKITWAYLQMVYAGAPNFFEIDGIFVQLQKATMETSIVADLDDSFSIE